MARHSSIVDTLATELASLHRVGCILFFENSVLFLLPYKWLFIIMWTRMQNMLKDL